MLIIPAVDIKDGQAVRLKQGRAEERTVYGDDPVAAARRWAEGGARRIHIVDLDGAFEGAPRNLVHTLAILKAFAATHEIEIGGGLRTVETVAQLIDAGAARCVIGTKALDDRTFLETLCRRFPGRINVGIDAKDGFVVTRGWVNVSAMPATTLAGELAALPLGEIIYTDIARDGMLQGPNLTRLAEMRAASPFPIIASGGVTTVQDIRDCKALKCFGAIVGKALYDGPLTLAEALDAGAKG
jgi:phosphoribosylformimino-5-aminoimidazole carboxamide ribotide isomerase